MANLMKKTKAELIELISSKNDVISTLEKSKEEVINQYETRIKGFEADMKGMDDIVKYKQEQIDTLVNERNMFEAKYEHTKQLAIFRKKLIFGLCGITTILFVLLIVL